MRKVLIVALGFTSLAMSAGIFTGFMNSASFADATPAESRSITRGELKTYCNKIGGVFDENAGDAPGSYSCYVKEVADIQCNDNGVCGSSRKIAFSSKLANKGGPF